MELEQVEQGGYEPWLSLWACYARPCFIALSVSVVLVLGATFLWDSTELTAREVTKRARAVCLNNRLVPLSWKLLRSTHQLRRVGQLESASTATPAAGSVACAAAAPVTITRLGWADAYSANILFRGAQPRTITVEGRRIVRRGWQQPRARQRKTVSRSVHCRHCTACLSIGKPVKRFLTPVSRRLHCNIQQPLLTCRTCRVERCQRTSVSRAITTSSPPKCLRTISKPKPTG
jgi:hypothetical protein